jgi:hypothetical protein
LRRVLRRKRRRVRDESNDEHCKHPRHQASIRYPGAGWR